jgi:hypothetical protein
MKTKLFTLIALALSFNAIASKSMVNTDKKAKVLHAKSVQKYYSRKVYLIMQGNQMHVFKGGVASPMQNNIWLNNQIVVTPLGAVLSNTGTRIWLVNGDKIDGNGVVTSDRCDEFENTEPLNTGTCLIP